MSAVSRRRRALGVPLERPIEAADLMLATLHRTPFDHAGWLYELKYDGLRCLVCKGATGVQLLSRTGNPLTPAFPEVAAGVARLRGELVLDAELSVDDAGGHPRFARVAARARMLDPRRINAAAHAEPARLYLFDVLAADCRDLRGLPLSARKAVLRDAFDDSGALVYVVGIVGAGRWVAEQVVALGFEGMVAKRLDSTYRRGRSRDWLKIKNAAYHRRAALGLGRHS